MRKMEQPAWSQPGTRSGAQLRDRRRSSGTPRSTRSRAGATTHARVGRGPRQSRVLSVGSAGANDVTRSRRPATRGGAPDQRRHRNSEERRHGACARRGTRTSRHLGAGSAGADAAVPPRGRWRISEPAATSRTRDTATTGGSGSCIECVVCVE